MLNTLPNCTKEPVNFSNSCLRFSKYQERPHAGSTQVPQLWRRKYPLRPAQVVTCVTEQLQASSINPGINPGQDILQYKCRRTVMFKARVHPVLTTIPSRPLCLPRQKTVRGGLGTLDWRPRGVPLRGVRASNFIGNKRRVLEVGVEV